MGSGGVIVTIAIFGVGQLIALCGLIFQIGIKSRQVDDHERRILALEGAKDVLMPAVARLQAKVDIRRHVIDESAEGSQAVRPL